MGGLRQNGGNYPLERRELSPAITAAASGAALRVVKGVYPAEMFASLSRGLFLPKLWEHPIGNGQGGVCIYTNTARCKSPSSPLIKLSVPPSLSLLHCPPISLGKMPGIWEGRGRARPRCLATRGALGDVTSGVAARRRFRPRPGLSGRRGRERPGNQTGTGREQTGSGPGAVSAAAMAGWPRPPSFPPLFPPYSPPPPLFPRVFPSYSTRFFSHLFSSPPHLPFLVCPLSSPFFILPPQHSNGIQGALGFEVGTVGSSLLGILSPFHFSLELSVFFLSVFPSGRGGIPGKRTVLKWGLEG